jgi:branched-chain amino acid transport system substrate-binding protein
MKRYQSVTVVFCLLPAITVLLCCGSFVKAAFGENVLKVGLITSMTGPLAPPMSVMIEAMKPVEELMDKRGGISVKGQKYTIQIIAEDDQSTPVGAIGAVNRLIQGGIKFIVAPLFPPCYIAIAPIVEEAKVLTVLSFGAVPDFVNKDKHYTFGAGTFVYMPPVAIDYLKKHYPKVKKIAMFSPDDPGAKTNVECAEKEARARGLDVVFQERFKVGSEDFYPVLTRLLQKKPDAIDLVLSIEPWSAGIINQSRELGFTGPIYASAGLLGDINIVKGMITEKYQHDLFQTGPDVKSAAMPALVKEYRALLEPKAKNPFQSSHLAVLDAVYTMAQGIEKAQSLDPDKVVQVLEAMKSIDTTCGKGRVAGKDFFGVNHVVRRPTPISGIMDKKVICEFSNRD